MAVAALQAEEPGMDLRLGVALRAGIRGATEYLALVAILAADFCVTTVQGEDVGMVEIVHTIDAIVTILAGAAVLFRMPGHESGIVVCMAGGAGICLESLDS